MIINISKSVGTGPTKLAAFDSALNSAGVANYNLIRLSSVIPPRTDIVQADKPLDNLPGAWGDRLYVVMAEIRVDKPNEQAWAGIGWVQDADTRQGLFVEHEGYSEGEVRSDIEQSLTALMATRGIDYGQIRMEVVGGVCSGQPVCAVVVAVYQASDWLNKPHIIAD